MSKVYSGAVGVELRVNTMIALTGATKTVLKVRKPNKHDDEWGATPDGTILKYTTVDGDLDLYGTYLISAYVEFGVDAKYYGETAKLEIYQPLSV